MFQDSKMLIFKSENLYLDEPVEDLNIYDVFFYKLQITISELKLQKCVEIYDRIMKLRGTISFLNSENMSEFVAFFKNFRYNMKVFFMMMRYGVYI